MEEASQSSSQKQLLSEQLSALLRQERSSKYSCGDYLSMTAWQTDIYQLMQKRRNSSHRMIDNRIDEFCREQICEWSYRVVDYFRIDREVVSVSLSYLDRFLSTCSCDRSMFKLAATTTLYMAVKIFHPHKLGDLGILSDLSRGEFEMKDVSEMEAHILRALSWNLYPPTAVAFSALLLDFLVADDVFDMTSSEVADIYDLTSFFGEIAACDYFFVRHRPSTTAVACVLNALEGMFGHGNHLVLKVLAVVENMNLPVERQELSATRSRLWKLYERSEECALHKKSKSNVELPTINVGVVTKHSSNQGSPVSVNVSNTFRAKSTDDLYPTHISARPLQNGSW